MTNTTRRPHSRITPKASREGRRLILKALSVAHSGKSESGAWLEVETLHPQAKFIITQLLRLCLVETKKEGKKETLVARITQYGLYAIAEDKLTYGQLQKSLQIPVHVYERLLALAKELGVTRTVGRGAKDQASVVGLIGYMVEKPELYKRWWKSNFGEVK